MSVFTFFEPMEFPMKYHTVKAKWSIVYIIEVTGFQKYNISVPLSEDCFRFSKQRTYEMPHSLFIKVPF